MIREIDPMDTRIRVRLAHESEYREEGWLATRREYIFVVEGRPVKVVVTSSWYEFEWSQSSCRLYSWTEAQGWVMFCSINPRDMESATGQKSRNPAQDAEAARRDCDRVLVEYIRVMEAVKEEAPLVRPIPSDTVRSSVPDPTTPALPSDTPQLAALTEELDQLPKPSEEEGE